MTGERRETGDEIKGKLNYYIIILDQKRWKGNLPPEYQIEYEAMTSAKDYILQLEAVVENLEQRLKDCEKLTL